MCVKIDYLSLYRKRQIIYTIDNLNYCNQVINVSVITVRKFFIPFSGINNFKSLLCFDVKLYKDDFSKNCRVIDREYLSSHFKLSSINVL